jgi:hypothetical protein
MCPSCGLYLPSGLKQHEGGRRCQVEASIRDLRARGWAMIPHHAYERILQECGFTPERHPATVDYGHRNRPVTTRFAGYAPRVLVDVVKKRTEGIPSFVGRVRLPIAAIRRNLRHVITKGV